MTANNNKSYLGYINEFADEYNNTYHYSVGKNSIDANYFVFSEEIGKNPQTPTFKLSDRLKITKYKIF